jgi:8-oxo-dGTP pyrophosphatase MutT (NUDIX family)
LPTPLTFPETEARLRAALAERPPRRLAVEGFHRAAVLVPVLARPEGPTLLFTRRTDSVRRHKGEIGFPGGRMEPGEVAREAALREALEEVALDPAAVEVLGELDERPVVTRYLVTPVVGLVRRPPDGFSPEEREVREIFEVPVGRFLDPGMPRGEWWDGSRLPPDAERRPLLDLRDEEIDREAGRYRVWFYDVAPDRVIWGFTARVLKDLVDRALAPRGP